MASVWNDTYVDPIRGEGFALRGGRMDSVPVKRGSFLEVTRE